MARKYWTLTAVVTSTFMLLLDISVVNTALPTIQRAFHASLADLQWVIDAYTLPLAAIVLTAGSLADRLGRRGTLLVGLTIFTLASAACALAPSASFLIAARGVQGVGGAVMFALSLALVGHEFEPGPERGRAMAVFGATIGFAVAIGPLVGGVLTRELGWESVFFLNVPLGAATIAITIMKLAESRDPCAPRVDKPGLLALSGSLFALVLALLRANADGWGSAEIVSLFAVAAVLFASFLTIESRVAKPMLPLGLFRVRTFTGVQIAAFAVSVSMFALILYITLYLQQYLGDSPLDAGLKYLPLTLSMFLAAAVAGITVGRLPARVTLGAGLALAGLGLILMSRVEVGSKWTVLLVGFIVAGIGIGIANAVTGDVAMSIVSTDRSGMAAGINDTFRQVGIAIGIAAWGAIFLSRGATAAASFAHQPSARGRQLIDALSTGGIARLPAGLADAARHGFITGFHEILLLGGGIALLGAIATISLVRGQEIAHATPSVVPRREGTPWPAQ
jgi:EmrB/QacA subfamily drug resistance transporter